MALYHYYASLAFITLILGSVLYCTRTRWIGPIAEQAQAIADRVPSFRYTRLPTSFAGDAEAGLSSSTFDLSGNVEDGDSRAGLDDASKREILKIMKRRRLPFDEARKVYMEQRFRDNGIGADGRPRDPKFVSFS